MKAKVTQAFDGVPDGKVHPVTFNPGDEVEGELAKVAVANKWARKIGAARKRGGKKADESAAKSGDES